MATRENARATNNFFASATPPLQNYWSHIVNHVPSQFVNYVTLDNPLSPTIAVGLRGVFLFFFLFQSCDFLQDLLCFDGESAEVVGADVDEVVDAEV